MRYFVYRDAQILGPYGQEELDQAGGLHPETLICEEGISGARDSDWKCLQDVPELSGLRVVLPGAAVVLSEEFPSAAEAGLLERLELESLGVPGTEEALGSWIEQLFEDSDFKKRWEKVVEKPAQEAGGLSPAEQKVRELTGQIEALQSRLIELESRESPTPAAPFETTQATPAFEPPQPEPQRKAFKLSPPKTLPRAGSAPPPPAPTPAPVAPPISAGDFPKKGVKFSPKGLTPSAPAPAGPQALKFSPAKAFRVVKKEIPPAETLPHPASEQPAAGPPGAAPVFDWQVPSPKAAVLPPAPPPAPAPVLPVLQPPAQAAPPAGPPAGGLFGTPAGGEEPPRTMAFSGPSPSGLSLPRAALTPSRSSPGAAPVSASETQEVIARLAKPAPAPETEAKPQRRSPKVFLAASSVLLVGLAVAAFLFFHNSKDIKTMLTMGSDQKPLGSEPPEEPGSPRAKPAKPAPKAAPPAPAAALPKQEVASDAGEEAIRLVQGYPLGGGRSSVGQWLQYSFTANPGDGNKEEWTAGAVDATTYLVQYRILPGPKSGVKETITYLFEADPGRKTVKGSNPQARQLLAGAATAKTKRIKAAGLRRRGRRLPAQAKPKPLPLIPLPSDSDLLAPADDDSSFKGDTVKPSL